MFDPADDSPQPAENGAKELHTSPICDVSTTSSNICDETGGSDAVGAAGGHAGYELSTTGRPASEEARSTSSSSSAAAADRTAVEKIHLLPISEEAPKAWVFGALTGIMRERKTVRQYMYVRVKRPAKEPKSPRRTGSGDNNGNNQITERADVEYTYIVVACLPHSGIVTPSTMVFTSGSPLKPLRRVQLLALVHPNSSYARRAGVTSYSEALQRGLVGEASAGGRSSSSGGRGEGDASQPNTNSTSLSGSSSSVGAGSGTRDTANERRHLGSPFEWGEPQGRGERHRRGPIREFNRAEDVIAAVLDDSGLGSDGESGEEEDSMGGGVAFRLSEAYGPGKCEAESDSPGSDQPLQQQRTLQRNFNFPSSSGDLGQGGEASGDAERTGGASIRGFSERVLFYDFVAPYFRARSASASTPPSPTSSGGDGEARETAVVVFPGKKLVIKDLTFVVWATDPDNGPGFVREDTVSITVLLLLSAYDATPSHLNFETAQAADEDAS